MNREATAYHEAGHAVIGRIVGIPCGRAAIEADHDSAGHGVTDGPWDAMRGAWERRGKFRDVASVFRGRIIAFAAGAEAECVFS